MNNPLARSLSLRLLAIFAATAFLLIAILVALFTHGLSSQWQRSIRPHLVQYVRYVQQDLGSPPDPERARQLADALPVTIAIYRDGRFVYATDGRPADLETLRFRRLPRRVQRQLAIAERFTAEHGRLASRHDGRGRGVTREVPAGSPSTPDDASVRAAIAHENAREGAVLRLEQGPDTIYYRLERPGRRHGGADGLYRALFAVILVLLTSYLLIRRQLAPIRDIQRGVRRMSDGELTHRVGLDGRDDLAELGRSIDEMAARIGDMLDAKRQLLLAISHELRSPLARARVATELLPESRQRERLESDLADMARLIEDLTESERLRTPHSALHRESLDLVRLVAEELAPHGLVPRLIGDGEEGVGSGRDERGGDHDEGDDGKWTERRSLPIVADAARLRVLVRNLVGNALRHGRSANGEADVTVTLSRTSMPSRAGRRSGGSASPRTVTAASGRDAVRLVVADRGPGIAAEHLEAVTEPFHRPDASRTRASGGIGLGLSLARLVAEAHGGTLRIESDPATEPGTRVTVVLPLDGDAADQGATVS